MKRRWVRHIKDKKVMCNVLLSSQVILCVKASFEVLMDEMHKYSTLLPFKEIPESVKKMIPVRYLRQRKEQLLKRFILDESEEDRKKRQKIQVTNYEKPAKVSRFLKDVETLYKEIVFHLMERIQSGDVFKSNHYDFRKNKFRPLFYVELQISKSKRVQENSKDYKQREFEKKKFRRMLFHHRKMMDEFIKTQIDPSEMPIDHEKFITKKKFMEVSRDYLGAFLNKTQLLVFTPRI